MAVTQGIKLDEETRNRLKVLAEQRQRSPHWLMRQAIEDNLDREEKIESEKREDLARWQAYQLTGHSIEHEAASAWLRELASGNRATKPE